MIEIIPLLQFVTTSLVACLFLQIWRQYAIAERQKKQRASRKEQSRIKSVKQPQKNTTKFVAPRAEIFSGNFAPIDTSSFSRLPEPEVAFAFERSEPKQQKDFLSDYIGDFFTSEDQKVLRPSASEIRAIQDSEAMNDEHIVVLERSH